MQATVQIHGRKTTHLSRWQAEQRAQQEISRTQYRAPNFLWRNDSPRNRAGVTVYLTLKDDIIEIEKTHVVISRNYYRGGERRYNNVTLASLRRLSALPSVPLVTAERFAATEAAQVAKEMLDAAQAQQEKFRLLDRVDAAIAYGQVQEMVNEQHESQALAK